MGHIGWSAGTAASSGARSRRSRDERGQVATAMFIVTFTALLAVALWGVFALSRGVDERSQAQSAADAAALAGAGALEAAIPVLLGELSSKAGLPGLGSSIGCGLGQGDAQQYAERNEAILTDYCFDFGADRVRAVVEMADPVSEDVGPAEAGALAETGVSLDGCTWEDEEPPPTPTPTPTPTPSGSPTATPTPTEPPDPPDLGTTLDCGFFTAQFTILGSSGLLRLDDVQVDPIEPRLID